MTKKTHGPPKHQEQIGNTKWNNDVVHVVNIKQNNMYTHNERILLLVHTDVTQSQKDDQ